MWEVNEYSSATPAQYYSPALPEQQVSPAPPRQHYPRPPRQKFRPKNRQNRPWTLEEVKLLKLRRGEGWEWEFIATYFPGRNANSCRLRYKSIKAALEQRRDEEQTR